MSKKNNYLDYSLNVWLSISILAPTLTLISDLILDISILKIKTIGVLFFTIFFVAMTALPFYLVLKKISKIIYDFQIPNYQVKLLITLVVFLFILATHILFFHKTLHEVSSFGSEENYFLRFLILNIQLAKYYLVSAAVFIWYFKIERENDFMKTTSMDDILDDDLDF